MSPHSIRGCCPHCGAFAAHAFASAVAADGEPGQPMSVSFGLRADQRFVCTGCEQSWEAAVVPKDQLRRLREAVTGLDEAKRQIAMLRLIMSKDQLERAEKSQRDIIQLRRAA